MRSTIVTVQPMGSCAPWQPARRAMIRLRGKWVAQMFAPYTQLQVQTEVRDGRTVLVLEPVPDLQISQAQGDMPPTDRQSELTPTQNTNSPTPIGIGDPES